MQHLHVGDFQTVIVPALADSVEPSNDQASAPPPATTGAPIRSVRRETPDPADLADVLGLRVLLFAIILPLRRHRHGSPGRAINGDRILRIENVFACFVGTTRRQHMLVLRAVTQVAGLPLQAKKRDGSALIGRASAIQISSIGGESSGLRVRPSRGTLTAR